MIRRIVAAALLTCGVAPAQSTPAKPLAFEVVSIRPSKPDTPMMTKWGIEPDGYRVAGQSVWSTLMIAYFPQGMAYWSKERISSTPSWLGDQYDIDAKVPEADIAEWQKQGQGLDKEPMFRQMLQSMLADRFHLVAHMAPGPPVSGDLLEIGKRGAKLVASTPGAALPSGVPSLDGGVMVYEKTGGTIQWRFYNATMADLARYLSGRGSGPVEDRTNLTGRYDFVLRWSDVDPEHPERTGVTFSDDPNPLSHWDLDSLGLRATPIKLPADTLVIDHIEKPSEN